MNNSRREHFDKRYKKGTGLWAKGQLNDLFREFVELLQREGVKSRLWEWKDFNNLG